METIPDIESLSKMEPQMPVDKVANIQSYIIKEKCQSVSADIFFTKHLDTNENVVIKILKPTSDVRYKKLDTISDRQQCQLEALHWNKRFTQDVYIGLGKVYSLSFDGFEIGDVINLGEVLEESILLRHGFDPHSEYALVMHQLPCNRRLDVLLKAENEDSRLFYCKSVVNRVIELHKSVPLITGFNDDGDIWGSVDQLEKKLVHNLELFDLVFRKDKNNVENYRVWKNIKTFIHRLFTEGRLPDYFQQRIKDQCIKRCHGDLKAPNIWIKPGDHLYDDKKLGDVLILDTIDFNPLYSNIDVLSDIALLITDIHARTHSRTLADQVAEHYLKVTVQDNEVCNAILRYYLIEKAIVSAQVINFDENPDLDLASSFWEIAQMRMKDA